jgi:hypothetical protein
MQACAETRLGKAPDIVGNHKPRSFIFPFSAALFRNLVSEGAIWMKILSH